jgi:DNA-binding NtrC family response regulator
VHDLLRVNRIYRRELENLFERATIMETKNVISIGSLPPNVTKFVTQPAAGARKNQE